MKKRHEAPPVGEQNIVVFAADVRRVWDDRELGGEDPVVCHGLVHGVDNADGFIPEIECDVQELDGGVLAAVLPQDALCGFDHGSVSPCQVVGRVLDIVVVLVRSVEVQNVQNDVGTEP